MTTKPLNLNFSILELIEATGEWHFRDAKLECPSKESLPSHCYVFLADSELPLRQKEPALRDKALRQVLRHFNVPLFLTTSACDESNGYFGCESSFGEAGQMQGYATWFRCLVKEVHRDGTKMAYMWHEMSFFTQWFPGHSIVLCIGAPKKTSTRLASSLAESTSPLNFSDPFSMHVPILDQMIILYDESVWQIRHMIRRREKIREKEKDPFAQSNFSELHDIARHSIHCFETLAVTIDTITSMQQRQHDFHINIPSESGTAKRAYKKTQDYLGFQLQMIRNLKLRAESNHERLKNEITLAFNMITQRDSTTMVGIGQATKADSSAMKTVAMVTMIFLPATFTSAVFSMSFFDLVPGDSTRPDKWVMSGKFWIYWVVAIPLTALTVAVWFVWQHWSNGRLELNGFVSNNWGPRFALRRPNERKRLVKEDA